MRVSVLINKQTSFLLPHELNNTIKHNLSFLKISQSRYDNKNTKSLICVLIVPTQIFLKCLDMQLLFPVMSHSKEMLVQGAINVVELFELLLGILEVVVTEVLAF